MGRWLHVLQSEGEEVNRHLLAASCATLLCVTNLWGAPAPLLKKTKPENPHPAWMCRQYDMEWGRETGMIYAAQFKPDGTIFFIRKGIDASGGYYIGSWEVQGNVLKVIEKFHHGEGTYGSNCPWEADLRQWPSFMISGYYGNMSMKLNAPTVTD